jgi:ATP-binding cassette subfamily C (CFTR/MRP) protein 1
MGNTHTSVCQDSPFERAGLFSKVLYIWIDPLIKLGSEKPLESSDIPPLPRIFTCKQVKDLAEPRWKEHSKKPKPFIGYPVVSAFFLDFSLSGLLFFPYIGVVLLQPFFVSSLLQYVSNGHSSFLGITSGVGQAVVLGILSIVGVLCVSMSFFYTSTAAIPIKSAIIALIFEKSLRLSSGSRTKFTSGMHSQQCVVPLLISFLQATS